MTRKRFSEEDILGILRQIELDLAGAGDSTSKWYITRGLDTVLLLERSDIGHSGGSLLCHQTKHRHLKHFHQSFSLESTSTSGRAGTGRPA